MKKLFALCLLISSLARAQQGELGVNYGFGVSVAASIRFQQHFKAGLGYESVRIGSTAIFGDSWKNQLHIPFLYAEYYNHLRKHEFYYGIDAGKMYVTEFYDYRPDINQQGYEVGLHAGYSRKLITDLYVNAQAGLIYFHTPGHVTHEVFIPLSIGLHYIFQK